MTVTDEMAGRALAAYWGPPQGREWHPKELAVMHAALTAALSEQAGGWMPISTAPKDGTRIEYHNGRTIDPVIGYCRWATWPEDDLEDWWDYERDCEACPKFWRPEQPLPAPPPSSTTGEVG